MARSKYGNPVAKAVGMMKSAGRGYKTYKRKGRRPRATADLKRIRAAIAGATTKVMREMKFSKPTFGKMRPTGAYRAFNYKLGYKK